MSARESGYSQPIAAAKAGLSERTGRRIEKGDHQPKRGRPHDWRTRKDPLEEVWASELRPMLEREPKLQAMTLFEYLQDAHRGKYGRSILRTLQRRVQQWRATAGPAKPVMFELEHRPGEVGFSDFTHFKQAVVTIGRKPFVHLLYHYRLAYSGWQYVQVIQGGESFVALSEGIQNAFSACGGAPKEHRTDSLSAAYKNLGGRTDSEVTQLYDKLCTHYRLQPTRNNRGIAHENGSVESPHGHFKNRLHQAMLLRGSCDFKSVADYQALIEQVVGKLNQMSHERYEQERLLLQPLPAYRSVDYEVLSVRVKSSSAITVRCVTYTVPSRLIGLRVTVHLHHDRLKVFVGRQLVETLPRIHVPADAPSRRAYCVNYRHVVESLRQKPRGFLNSTWRKYFLPNDHYRQLWSRLCEQFDRYQAARLMTEALFIAAKQDKESAVARYLDQQLQAKTLTLSGLQRQFSITTVSVPPLAGIQQHSLDLYDQLLLCYDNSTPDGQCHPQLPAQESQAFPHESPVASS